MAAAQSYTNSGSVTKSASSFKITMLIETDLKKLKNDTTQELTLNSELAIGDYLETFTCWQRLFNEWICIRSALDVFDGTNFTIKNWAYSTSSAPTLTDFVPNESFVTMQGFSGNYTKLWDCTSVSTAAGTKSLSGTCSVSNDSFIWLSNNLVSTNKK